MCCYNEGYEPRLITNDAPGTQWHIASYDGELTECHDTNFLLLGASRVARWYACWRIGARRSPASSSTIRVGNSSQPRSWLSSKPLEN